MLALAAGFLVAVPGATYADGTCTGATSVWVTVRGDHDQGVIARHRFSPQEICDLYNIEEPAYQTRSVPGGAVQDEPRPDQVLSFDQLVQSVPVAPESVHYAQIYDLQGHPHVLTQAQVLGQGFENGLVPGVWFESGSDSMFFFRPLTGDADVNGPDFIETNSGQPLAITLHTSGEVLTPSVTASAVKVAVGDPVSFKVTIPDRPNTQFTYAWSFGDDTRDHDATPKHTWKSECTCTVSVIVHGADGSWGQSPGVAVRVGPAPPPETGDDPPGTGHHHGHHHPTTGQDTGNGNHQDGQPTGSPTPSAPSSGPSAPSSSPEQSPDPGPTSAPPSQQPVPSHRPAPNDADGRAVAGTLLLAAQPYAVPRHDTSVTEADGARAPTRTPRGWWWTAWLVVPLLVGLGMAGESLQLRRRLARMTA